jgi:hypothetical protein
MAAEVTNAASLKDALMKGLLLYLEHHRQKHLNDVLSDFERPGFTDEEIKAAVDQLVERHLVTLTIQPGRGYSPTLELVEGASVAAYEQSKERKAY